VTAEPTTFTGRPSVIAQVTVLGLRGVRVITDFLGIERGRQLPRLIATDSPPWFTARGLSVSRSEFDGMITWSLQPPSASGNYVVALHGGGFTVQPTIIHWLDYARLARDTGAVVVVPIYPLAPHGTASTVVPLIGNLISSLISRHGSKAVSVYGDSAGGTLALSAVRVLIQRGGLTPARMVLVAPGLDLTMTNPAIQQINDPILSVKITKRTGVMWADTLDVTDPLVSPLYGSFEGFPPTAIYSGSLDLLSADVLRLQQKTLAEGAPFTYVLRTGLFHVWTIGPVLPEASEVRPQIYQQLVGNREHGPKA